MAFTFEALKNTYTPLWQAATVTNSSATTQAKLVLKYKEVYLETQRKTNVPWWAVAIMHLREAGPQDVGRWKGVLHNGQTIVGTGRRTTIVPIGRGPFADWQTAAYDALVTMNGFNKITDWSPERVAYVLETFNGFGYRGHGIPSPYLWGGTSVQKRGKYVSDGVYNANVMDPQIGGMAVLKELLKLDPSIKLGGSPITSAVNASKGVAATTTGVVLAGAGLASQPQHLWPWIVGGAIVAGIIVWAIVHLAHKEEITNV